MNDSASDADEGKIDITVLNAVSAENLFRFFGSNFHVVGNNPCMYYDASSDEYVICGKKLFTKIKAENRKDAMASFHEFLCVRGYSPDGDSAMDQFQKVKMNGQDAYVATMDDLLPEIKPEERALFSSDQYAVMRKTSGTDAFRYLGNERNCPVVYASTKGLRIEGKNIQKEIKMENAAEALEAYGSYVDSIRKK